MINVTKFMIHVKKHQQNSMEQQVRNNPAMANDTS